MLSRRAFGTLMGAAACVGDAAASSVPVPTVDLDAISLAAHEATMRLAIAAAKANPFYPFGAVIVGPDDRAVLGQGVNNTKTNPTLHGEIAAINDYVARHGNQGWTDGIVDRIERQYGKARRVWLMDRGVPTEEVLAEMRAADPPSIISWARRRAA
jgi:hypothetical protein